MIEARLYDYLLADTAIADLVGSRVYPLRAPQTPTLPLLVYQTISSVPDHHLRGASGLNVARMQVDCLASTYAGVKELADAVRLRCDGYRGYIGVEYVESMTVDMLTDAPEPPYSGSESGDFRVVIDLRIAYQQTPAAQV